MSSTPPTLSSTKIVSPPRTLNTSTQSHSNTGPFTEGTVERSAVVLALFGASVGPCVGDFSTSYNRVNGRLYVAKNAILFYSNLFGFERRLHLVAADIVEITLFGSTSIRIAMVDCEEYIFKKIANRTSVLALLRDVCREAGGLKKTAVNNLSSHNSAEDLSLNLNDAHTQGGVGENASSNRPHLSSESTDSMFEESQSSDGEFRMIQRGNRRRAQSAPSLAKDERQADYQQSESPSRSFFGTFTTSSASLSSPKDSSPANTFAGSSEEILSLGINSRDIVDSDDIDDWKKKSKPLSEIALKVRGLCVWIRFAYI